MALSNITEGKKPDLQRLENLYIDYKKQQIKKRQLKTNFEKDQGITFKPKLLIDENYVPKNGFYERNDLLLAERKLNAEFLRKMDLQVGRKDQVAYSPEQREEINRSIQERLYKPAVEKLLNKANLKSNQFTKKKFAVIGKTFDDEEKGNMENTNNVNNNQVYVNNINVINVIESSERLNNNNPQGVVVNNQDYSSSNNNFPNNNNKTTTNQAILNNNQNQKNKGNFKEEGNQGEPRRGQKK